MPTSKGLVAQASKRRLRFMLLVSVVGVEISLQCCALSFGCQSDQGEP
jgi:hypothetical protein